VRIASGGDELLTLGLPPISERTFSGTMTSAAGDDDVFSEPALLLRASENEATH
jgi:hypothetical protein